MFDTKKLNSLLSRFEAHSNGSEYQWHYFYDGGDIDFQLQVNSIIHGNEVGSLPAVVRIIEALQKGVLHFKGRLSVILGNPEAARKNQRFLEKDLNRLFLDNDSQSHEASRARQLMPILDHCDLLLDLHQTILSSNQAFYIFPWSTESGQWAQAINTCTSFVDATPSLNKPMTTRCGDEYIWQKNRPAVTIELGQKGFFQFAEDLAYQSILTTMRLIEERHQGISLEELSLKQPSLDKYETVHREPYHTEHHQLKPGLINFMSVRKGESIEAQDSPKMIVPKSGLLLFPKYPKRLNGVLAESKPKEIYRIIQQT
jgi:succinylglutamate desuccinylase